jgi:hypothetical protein
MYNTRLLTNYKCENVRLMIWDNEFEFRLICYNSDGLTLTVWRSLWLSEALTGLTHAAWSDRLRLFLRLQSVDVDSLSWVVNCASPAPELVVKSAWAQALPFWLENFGRSSGVALQAAASASQWGRLSRGFVKYTLARHPLGGVGVSCLAASISNNCWRDGWGVCMSRESRLRVLRRCGGSNGLGAAIQFSSYRVTVRVYGP